jgi:hypothetical protein
LRTAPIGESVDGRKTIRQNHDFCAPCKCPGFSRVRLPAECVTVGFATHARFMARCSLPACHPPAATADRTPPLPPSRPPPAACETRRAGPAPSGGRLPERGRPGRTCAGIPVDGGRPAGGSPRRRGAKAPASTPGRAGLGSRRGTALMYLPAGRRVSPIFARGVCAAARADGGRSGSLPRQPRLSPRARSGVRQIRCRVDHCAPILESGKSVAGPTRRATGGRAATRRRAGSHTGRERRRTGPSVGRRRRLSRSGFGGGGWSGADRARNSER